MRLRTVPIAPLIAAALGHAPPQFDVASVKPDAECDSRRSGRALGGIVERPVIDRTGLPGRYDIHLEYARDRSLDAIPEPSTGPTIFEALRQQLGLRLRADRGPVDVVDHDERPAGN